MNTGTELLSPKTDTELLRIADCTKLVASARFRQPRISRRTREELNRLVQRLFLSPQRTGGPSIVMFSSVEHGSGCTWTCTRIAEILAERTDGRICLMDANFRSSGRHQEFEFDHVQAPEDEWTFAPVTRNGYKANRSNLWLLSYRPLSKHCPTPADVQGFQLRMSHLRHDFSHVLIDAPPLSEFSDAALYGSMTDGLVMVIEANNTHRESARKAKQFLEDCGVPVLGAVLNKRSFPIPDSIYRRL